MALTGQLMERAESLRNASRVRFRDNGDPVTDGDYDSLIGSEGTIVEVVERRPHDPAPYPFFRVRFDGGKTVDCDPDELETVKE